MTFLSNPINKLNASLMTDDNVIMNELQGN